MKAVLGRLSYEALLCGFTLMTSSYLGVLSRDILIMSDVYYKSWPEVRPHQVLPVPAGSHLSGISFRRKVSEQTRIRYQLRKTRTARQISAAPEFFRLWHVMPEILEKLHKRLTDP
ncbi:hypothetical protein TNCT_268081 [Trichonephila clavata]|uniref:Uncharacterized protein n=1 Tax=Trichonephila clavata TaxID=2740835 RepID=A0A8X6LFA7_TRICU|nr:hypothetical protein TNCT_268081 [Trichonephila clavata]